MLRRQLVILFNCKNDELRDSINQAFLMISKTDDVKELNFIKETKTLPLLIRYKASSRLKELQTIEEYVEKMKK